MSPETTPAAAARSDEATYVALSGGVGGAKLSLGLAHLLGPRLTILVNVGDDFEHLGLHISPDVDTALYTLADLVNPATGWGRRDETWTFMKALDGLGGPQWFNLGDGDLALHVERTRRLRAGEPLSAIVADIARRLAIAARVLPAADDPARTVVDTDQGTLDFQHYFVREQCRPRVTRIRFDIAGGARLLPAAAAALAAPSLAGIIVCPSNPYLSIDPMLAVPGLREALAAARAPVIAVSPIVGGRAIKGPTAKIMAELGLEVTAATVARHYAGLIDGFVLDAADAACENAIAVPVRIANTVMQSLDDKITLGADCLAFCEALQGAGV